MCTALYCILVHEYAKLFKPYETASDPQWPGVGDRWTYVRVQDNDSPRNTVEMETNVCVQCEFSLVNPISTFLLLISFTEENKSVPATPACSSSVFVGE